MSRATGRIGADGKHGWLLDSHENWLFSAATTRRLLAGSLAGLHEHGFVWDLRTGAEVATFPEKQVEGLVERRAEGSGVAT